MTSGSEGLHVAVPLKANQNYDVAHDFAKKKANYIRNNNPTELSTFIRKDKHKGRVF
jgi:bifunctional non-homologous end joining protein LigD